MEETVRYLRKFVNDPEILELYDNTKLIKLNAYDNGKQEGLIATAKNMLNLNLALDVIMKATGLTKNEIEALKQ